MDKDNKRGKGSIHTTPTHTHRREKKAFEVSEHLSNLQSSLEHIVSKNTEKIYLTWRQIPAELQLNEGLDVSKTRGNKNKINVGNM